jgi:hypothetical protein
MFLSRTAIKGVFAVSMVAGLTMEPRKSSLNDKLNAEARRLWRELTKKYELDVEDAHFHALERLTELIRLDNDGFLEELGTDDRERLQGQLDILDSEVKKEEDKAEEARRKQELRYDSEDPERLAPGYLEGDLSLASSAPAQEDDNQRLLIDSEVAVDDLSNLPSYVPTKYIPH